MSVLSDISEKLDELKKSQEEQKARRKELVENAKKAEQTLEAAKQAIEDYDELCKHTDDKLSMLDMILIALNNEREAKTIAAKTYHDGLSSADDKSRFLEFIATQGVDPISLDIEKSTESGST